MTTKASKAVSILRVKRSDIRPGRWVRVMWDDIGARDGIVIEKTDNGRSCRVYFPFDTRSQSVECDQIVKVGSSLRAKDSGL